jgi:hypothetical protein
MSGTMKTFAIQAKQASRVAEVRAKAEGRGLLYDETDPSFIHSITRTSFEQGIGVAFNNCTGITEPLRLDENARLDVQIVRSDAHLSVDNHPELLMLSQGDSALVRKAEQDTRLVGHQ